MSNNKLTNPHSYLVLISLCLCTWHNVCFVLANHLSSLFMFSCVLRPGVTSLLHRPAVFLHCVCFLFVFVSLHFCFWCNTSFASDSHHPSLAHSLLLFLLFFLYTWCNVIFFSLDEWVKGRRKTIRGGGIVGYVMLVSSRHSVDWTI